MYTNPTKRLNSPFAHKVNGRWYLSAHAAQPSATLEDYKHALRRAYGSLEGVEVAVQGIDYGHFILENAALLPQPLVAGAAAALDGPAQAVTVVGAHTSWPLECSTTGTLYADGSLVIHYPFRWQNGAEDFDRDAAIDITHVVPANGTVLTEGWVEAPPGGMAKPL